jgi:hypothetical protein
MKIKKTSREQLAHALNRFGWTELPADSPYFNEVSIAFLSRTPRRQQRKDTSSTQFSSEDDPVSTLDTGVEQKSAQTVSTDLAQIGEITLGSFDLPFAVEGSEDELPQQRCEQLEALEGKIPDQCIFLGQINSETDHSPGLTWVTEDYYYLLPWEGSEYDWGLFRITWDDNYGNFDWSADARIKGVFDPKEAARQLFAALMEQWGYEANADYSNFLKSI